MTFEELESVLEDYLQMETTNYSKPSWFDCLAFLSGYCGAIDINMVMLVRKLQREGRVE